MDIPDVTVSLKCLFCSASLQGPEEAEYSSCDLIKCAQCGEENDLDSVLDVAKEKGVEEMTKEAEKQVAKEMKRILKNL
jgi:hypothetical protein